MCELTLPRLISDGMILQQKKKVRIWGWDEPGRKVSVSFLGSAYDCETGINGGWEVFLKEMKPGGPYEMQIADDAGEEKQIRGILVGDVWMCSGQSNMELPMRRVIDRYPQELIRFEEEESGGMPIRTFKITEKSDFHGPLEELESGEWTDLSKDTILDFSATAYFFAKHFHQVTGVPVGLINASLGGSRIESWMGRDMLAGYPDFLALADRYCDDDFVKGQLQKNEEQAFAWHNHLDAVDLGLQENWAKWDSERGQIGAEADNDGWNEVEIPFFFENTGLKGFIGSVWFRREFEVGENLAGKAAKLWLGTIVDSDTVYVNGVCVGHTEYQYPPRKYAVPEGLLCPGKNTIVIRVKCETGHGRFTDGKTYSIFRGDDRIELAGVWQYRIGASCEIIGETDFVNWKPTGLYHAMTAPCHKYAVAGVLWYQGESNTHAEASRYLDLTGRMIAGYREKWEEELPFFYVQLPNFAADIYEKERNETYSDWPGIREAQRRALKIPGTGMAVAIDLGEDNDLHPLNKEDIGYRLAMLAAAELYGLRTECSGPQVEKVSVEGIPVPGNRKQERAEGRKRTAEDGQEQMICQVTLHFRNATGMYAYSKEKGMEIRDFELIDDKGQFHTAKAVIAGNDVILKCDGQPETIREVRYCYHNTNRGALLYNEDGFPMSPFRLECGI